MKRINLKGISEILSEKELKNVMGGSYGNDLTICNGAGCSGNYCGSTSTDTKYCTYTKNSYGIWQCKCC